MKEHDDTVYRAISFTDLEEAGYRITLLSRGEQLELDKIRKDGVAITKEQFYKALKFLGLRINYKLTFSSKCEHLTLAGRRTKNHRIVGEERGDKDWLKSGFASDEAKAKSSKMGDMVSYLQRMGRGGDRG